MERYSNLSAQRCADVQWEQEPRRWQQTEKVLAEPMSIGRQPTLQVAATETKSRRKDDACSGAYLEAKENTVN
jgi:hypothetical protein